MEDQERYLAERREIRRSRRVKSQIISFSIIAAMLLVLVGIGAAVAHFIPEKEQVVAVPVEDETILPEITDDTEIEDVVEPEPEEVKDPLDELVELYMASMTLEEKVYGLFVVTPESLTGVATATRAGNATKEAIEQYPVGGVVYFSKNIQSNTQFKEMLLNTTKYSKFPLFIAIDEEGGTVARLANSTLGVTKVGDMSDVGATGDSLNAYSAYTTIGNYLASYGINLNFAPVADVWTNPDNTMFAKRSFGTDAAVVASMVSSAVTALQDTGVSATIKHFPGHGGVSGDSHEEIVTLDKTLEQLRETEFLPFIYGMNAGTDFVMVGHIAVPSVTGVDVPSTVSSAMVTDVLRGELEYDGVVITDAMNMAAITSHYETGEAAVLAIEAGVDMILMPEDFKVCHAAIMQAIQDGRISEERINESIRRIFRVKYKSAVADE